MRYNYEFLSNTFLFSGLNTEEISELLSEIGFEIQDYKRADLIYSPESYSKKVGFILSGKCDIIREKSENTHVTINTLSSGDSFGILAALSEEENFPTAVKAKSATTVLFINSSDLLSLMKSNDRIFNNVIHFLTDRISFLNKKIATYSADSVEEKLSSYLLRESSRLGSDAISFNCKHCAELIHAGRASVYRAIDNLSCSGTIKYENKKIYILDRKGLERTKK